MTRHRWMFRKHTNPSIRAVVSPEGDTCCRPSWHRWRRPGMSSPHSLRRQPRRCLASSYCHSCLVIARLRTANMPMSSDVPSRRPIDRRTGPVHDGHWPSPVSALSLISFTSSPSSRRRVSGRNSVHFITTGDAPTFNDCPLIGGGADDGRSSA